MKTKQKQKPKPRLMTDQAIRSYLDAAYEAGRRRCVEQGERFSAADFAADACVLLEFLGRMDMMPAEWFFGMMPCGRNPFGPKET